ncbi:M4 family metallopeptidase [Nocardioides sp. KR10-350]|uniref:M4 family metallopeptidase n=1 Tax=Nocardioides cheoyonin TaxID=3156615 RepID=UPI0032B32A93
MRRLVRVVAGAVLATGTLTAAATTTAAAKPVTPRPLVAPRLVADPSVAKDAVAALRAHPALARRTDGQGFTTESTLVDPDGSTHVRLERTYHGLPVIGGDLVVHRGPNDGWKGVSQTLAKPLELSVSPKVTAKAASITAMTGKAVASIDGLKRAGAPELVVDARSATPRLAWKVVTGGTRADGTPSRLETLVDARTGAVIRRVEQIETDSGEGQTLYSGTVPLEVTKSGSTYSLKDATRGGTYTTDFDNDTDGLLCQLLGVNCKTGTTFTSSTSTFGDGTTSDRASAGADAQYGTNMTWDYYKSTFGRNGIFGDGTGSYNRVHYGDDYVNAFWDGTKMTYGDGDGVSYGPLTSLDVAGHEMSHGVTENTAGLEYDGESGGLNESTSDIFGTMVEFYADNSADPGDYLIGEQFVLDDSGPLRRMDDPASDGSSANCWSSSVGDLDVHYSSGVGNHFFYLLTQGSGAKTLNGVSYDSPTCDGSTVTGIGNEAAEQIWYRALTVYMTSSTDYHGARTATLSAAEDLYGADSTEYAAVDAAWAAVGVTA